MQKCLAFVLGGGGARGALQVGALRALFEAGFKPDLLVGTSIGAVNATGLALWGLDVAGIEALEQAYKKVSESHLMDPRLARFAMDALARRTNNRGSRRIQEFFISEGITRELRFGQITDVRLAVVGADLDSARIVIYGTQPEQSVLEGVMASTALEPWFAPVEKEGHLIVDGGILSNLPIEPALSLGATEIIALDVDDPNGMLGMNTAHGQYLEKLVYAITQRQVCIETALASARGVPVQYVSLRSSPPIAIWDFRNHRRLFKIGYQIMQSRILGWLQSSRPEPVRPGLNRENRPAWISAGAG